MQSPAPPDASAATTPRLDSLTSLRFFAALAVVVLHLSGALPLLPPVEIGSRLGYVGVAFFFVLSGFVLAWSARPDDSPWTFYGRRLARVWPAHAVMTIAMIPVLLLDHSPPLQWSALPAVLLLVQAWIPNGTWLGAFNAQSWSLSCEAFFYAWFPALTIATRWPTRRVRYAAAAVAVLTVAAALTVAAVTPSTKWSYLLYVNPVYRIGEFALGMALATLIRRGWRPAWRISHSLAAIIITYIALQAAGRVPLFVADLAFLPGFMMLVAASARSDLDGRTGLLRRRWLVELGERSFALYLVHVAVIKVCWDMFSGYGWNSITWTVATVPITLLSSGVAAVLYATVERPAERYLKRRLTARLSGRPPQPALAVAEKATI